MYESFLSATRSPGLQSWIEISLSMSTMYLPSGWILTSTLSWPIFLMISPTDEPGLAVVDRDLLVDVHDVLAVGVDLDQHLVLAHLLDDFAHRRAGLAQRHQLVLEVAHLLVQVVA